MTGRDKNDFECQICILVLYFIKFSGTSICGIVKCARVCCPGTAGQDSGPVSGTPFSENSATSVYYHTMRRGGSTGTEAEDEAEASVLLLEVPPKEKGGIQSGEKGLGG